MIGFFILWSIVNYMSIHPMLLSQLVWIRLVLFCAAPLCLLVFLTFTAFPAQNLEGSSRIRKLALLYTILVMSLVLTPLVFKSLTITNGSANPQPGLGIVLFILLVIGLLGGGIWNLVSKYLHSTGNLKSQLRFVLVGLAGTFGLIFITNLIFVVVFKNNSFIPLGSTYTLIFTGSLAYAIVKHRLFDIRRAATRGLAYVLTISSLAVAYSIILFGITSLVLNHNTVNRSTEFINTALALALALSFQSIKRFFDRISNRIFYKDAYNPQDFLAGLNKVLVSEVELKNLLSKSMGVIEANLKCEGSTFVIEKTAYFRLRIVSTRNHRLNEKDIDRFRSQIQSTNQKVIVSDYLEGEDLQLGKELNERNIAVIVRLIPSLNRNDESVGEILLGPKKNGDPYTREDTKLLQIIANELVVAIQNALRFEEIENFNFTLQAKVNDATGKLRRVNEKLKALDETKDDFISMASHQLRTPLTSVKGYLSLVLDGDAGKIPEQQSKLLKQAFTSSQRMVYLISDLLNVSRLKTGKFVIETTPVNLSEVISDELAQLAETAQSRSVELLYDKPKDFPEVQLDETKTRQVIMNFVDNAIYYTPAGGHIKIALEDKPSSVELRVIDNGMGVPKSEQHHLFTKFYRAGNARKARPDGTGLGLFMAKKVIAAQGGAILFESQEGKGSTFGFAFSKAKLAAQPSSALVHPGTPIAK